VVVLVVALSLSTWAWQHHRQAGIMSWATTVLWTLPITTSLIGLPGRCAPAGHCAPPPSRPAHRPSCRTSS
jgi:hypothetical protein